MPLCSAHAAPDGAWLVRGVRFYRHAAPTELVGGFVKRQSNFSEGEAATMTGRQDWAESHLLVMRARPACARARGHPHAPGAG
jgi:hypothetical protein